MKGLVLIFFLVLFLCPSIVFAANSSDVVINEIAWMGSTNSANDEWMELKNNTASQVDLSGWSIQSGDGKLKINLKGAISADGFYLMERTDDTSVPDITAGLIYTGALSNSGVDLRLYDNLNNLIDEVNCTGKWFAGNNTTKQTMEKTSSGWQTSQAPRGSPEAQNNTVVENTTSLETTTPEPMETTNEQIKAAPAITYPSGVFINEILPNPEGPDETDEWIELYNSNSSDVDLSGWQIQDTTGTIITYTINPSAGSGQAKILANGFLIFKRPDTKIMLNNDQDGLNLLTPDAKISDSMAFTKAPLNQSYNKVVSGWVWSSTLTPGAKNIITAAQTKTASKTLSKTKNSVKNNDTADISQSLNINQEVPEGDKTANPWFLFFMVLITTVILAAIVLLIKLKFSKKQHVRT